MQQHHPLTGHTDRLGRRNKKITVGIIIKTLVKPDVVDESLFFNLPSYNILSA